MNNKKDSKELFLVKEKLAFQNVEKKNRAKEYSILNKELTESLKQIKKINNELTIAKTKAEESNSLKSMFLANMSHEIRTPMNAIMGFAEFLQEPGLSKDKQKRFVQVINSSCRQLLSVISDIIDISKIEAGQISMDSDSIDINNLLKELFLSYKKVAALKKIHLKCSLECPKELILVKTDVNRVKQILCNLLDNALKFTKEGFIDFGYKIKNDFIEFYVKDTGIGIAPENLELIFERFRQVETTDNRIHGGNGLGLSISKALIEKLGGTISVMSKFGKGSNVLFTIPYLKESDSNFYPNINNKLRRFTGGEGKTILIVEDEVNNYAYIEEILSSSKVNIVHAWEGSEAVEYVKNNADISLVLMDIKMQKMNGYEALRLIKQIRPDLPVIAQTAYALSQDKKQTQQEGFDNYISKPIAKNTLVDIISSYFN